MYLCNLFIRSTRSVQVLRRLLRGQGAVPVVAPGPRSVLLYVYIYIYAYI